MDLNQSTEFSAASSQRGQMHNFMPMPAAFTLPETQQDGGEGRHSRFLQLLKQNIDIFWSQRIIEIHNTSDFKSQHQLPLARVKKIMKSDEQVKMISADTPILFSKACELFILELTVRAWLHTEENRRRTLQRCDIGRAIRNDELLDFLVDVVQLDHHQEETNENNHGHVDQFDPFNRMHLPVMSSNGVFGMRNQDTTHHQFMEPKHECPDLK